MTLHILPYHLLLHLLHIAVSCHCPNHRAIKLQKIQQCLKIRKKTFDEEFNISHPDRNSEPHFPSQQELDDLVRDMGLTKSNAELLTSKLKKWNLLDLSCQSSSSRKGHERFSRYFSMTGFLYFCSDVDNLFEEFGIAHDPREWRLFIDRSSRCLKCILLHNGNQYPSIPIGHSGPNERRLQKRKVSF